MKQQYIEEGRVLAALGEQPGVVNVYTFIEENNTAYLVMDFVEGQSLDAYVKGRGGRLSVSETLAIMRPVIRALAGVHKRGVIHRDISPDNIMITHDRKVKLIDFGAARMYGNYNYLRVQKGGYSPIEQVTSGAQIGPYSDVYFQRTRNGDETTAASEATTQQILQTEIDASPVEEVDCTAYAQEFYDLCAKQHEAKGNTLTQRDEFTVAAKETAAKSAALVYTSMDELNAALTEIGNQAIATYKIPNTGWVTYTFSLKEDVATVKQALDTYIAQMNEENQGTVDLDNCAYLGVSVARAQDGTYFWAVFYQ